MPGSSALAGLREPVEALTPPTDLSVAPDWRSLQAAFMRPTIASGTAIASIEARSNPTSVGIEIERAHRAGPAAVPSLSLRALPQAPNWPRFSKPPYDPRTVGFPESGSGLGSHGICQGEPSPATRNCGAGAPFAPPSWSLHRSFATTQAPQNPAQSLAACPPSWPPSAQSPFAQHGRYPRRGGLASRLEGRYPLVVAHTGSCARPSPSQRLRFVLGRWVFAGCHQSLLGDGPSRHYLCDPCAGARTPTPPRSPVARVRFFTEDAGLTPI